MTRAQANKHQVGLVLSGGGAIGAYEVGVVRALNELQVGVTAVAGASIGALNGAVLAAAPSMAEGERRLTNLWQALGDTAVLRPNSGLTAVPVYLVMLASVGLTIGGAGALPAGLSKLLSNALGAPTLPQAVRRTLEQFSGVSQGLLSDAPLKQMFDEFLDLDALRCGMPLYVSVFPSHGAGADIGQWLAAQFNLTEGQASEFLHVQSLSTVDQRELLLASAALPLLFKPRTVGGRLYADGGLGGARTCQGNTPITPLLAAGCKTVIVTHLDDGSLWSRDTFPGATVLEIRPQRDIRRNGMVSDLLGFDPAKLTSWIAQGYEDTLHCVGRVLKAGAAVVGMHDATAQLSDALTNLEAGARPLDAAMAKLLQRRQV